MTASRRSAQPSVTTVLGQKAVWIAGVGVWAFAAVALLSFDRADSPSHAVAVHNEAAENLCGSVGAFLAYWLYNLLGLGAWVLLAGAGAWLWMTIKGHQLTQPIIRTLGVLVMAIAAAGLQGLVLPGIGPLPGNPEGLIAAAIDAELYARFAWLGSAVILLAGMAVGALAACEECVVAIPSALRRLFSMRRPHLPQRWTAVAARVGSLLPLPTRHEEEEEAYDDDDEYEYVDEEEEEEEEYEEEEEEDEEDDAPRRLTKKELAAKIAKIRITMGDRRGAAVTEEDLPRQQNLEGYKFPGLDILEEPEMDFGEKLKKFVKKQAQDLRESLDEFGIEAEVVKIEPGPTVALFSVDLAPGTKVAKIKAVAGDLARRLGAANIRIVPNTAGRTTVGIEVPNLQREKVRLKELMAAKAARTMALPMFLGKDASGEPLVVDLTKMPHMLIAGTTGSGKSVCMNSIIMSWLYTKRPDELKLILVDPKMVELSQFADIPHLACPVITEMSKAAASLEWAIGKMDERYHLFKKTGVRHLTEYNALSNDEREELIGPTNDLEKARIPHHLPYLVFMIDELSDLMMTNREVEQSIVRVAQKARATGIHLILATQRPQRQVVTGLIKSNMPCRIAFKVAGGIDSKIILDSMGAELLTGQGDMMVVDPGEPLVKRAQGAFVADPEVRKTVAFLKTVAAPSFERSLIALPSGNASSNEEGNGVKDPLFEEAVEIIVEAGRGSASLLQRRLSVGYSRASRMVEQMADAGILGDHVGSKARAVQISMEDWEQMKKMGSGINAANEFDDEAFDDDGEGVPGEYAGEYRG